MHVIILLARECYFPQSPSSHHQPVKTWLGICATDRTTKRRRKKTPYKNKLFLTAKNGVISKGRGNMVVMMANWILTES